MSLGPFPILLIPSTKNGKLQFWNNLTQQIIEADFSRPNIDDTSGATVMRDGVLIELAENEVDWDDSSGCPVIKLRPQKENLLRLTEDFSNNPWAVVSTGLGSDPVVTPNAGISPSGEMDADRLQFTINGGTSVADLAQIQQAFTLVTGSLYGYGIFLKSYDGNSYDIAFDFNSSPQPDILATVTDEWQLFTVEATAVSTGGFYRIRLRGTELTSKIADILAWGASTVLGAYDGYIPNPSNNNGLTRAANAFSFTDLVTKGVLSSKNQGSILIGFDAVLFVNNTSTNDNFLRLGNIEESGYIRFRGNNSRVYLQIVGYGLNSQLDLDGSTSYIFTWDLTAIKLYSPNGLIDQGTETDNISIDSVTSANGTTIGLKNISFSPIVLTEAQAIAALNEL
jgi:hypothetical protein